MRKGYITEDNKMYEQFKTLLVEKFEINPELITPDAHLTNDLGIDSLELADLVLDCEEQYGVVIDDDDIQKFVSVGDVVAYLSEISPE